jgi:nicotinamide mononucleotide (NMN) deamidase PncC
VLIRQKIARLRKVVKVVTEVKGRKRKYIRVVESLTVGEVTNLIAEREGSR